ncbi:hypothetical protein FC19_GL001907 [Liquorilactobacillus aquaticus DSM 21051]|uniref:Nitroreductase domain-containing protein n=1 Tax=Liquorilactobacillus aquaticus DSM 21051 TaxID=1423725 RepID=A0A0R2CZ20_9LACO|nr:nitroreductase family protein [Liquorilactobacillus aquaticus]KRM97263.1 hypothetical protein FC19_GL001907 [Liquorilactobacillus aquaticus DSM 21051]
MNDKYLELLKNRRSIYALGRNIEEPKKEITGLIKKAVRESPTAFNNQTVKAIVLFGTASEKVWEIVAERLKSEVPTEEAYVKTKEKVDSFKAGFGTILLFTDQAIVDQNKEQFSLYADNFQDWSEQGLGGAQLSIWAALAENKIGASLQHYNPLIDSQIKETFNVPENWVLRAEMPFGSIEALPGDKQYVADDQRFKVIED